MSEKLKQLREIIHSVAPNAVEVISYKMPAYKQHSVLVYFAGYDSHVGFYPTAAGIEEFKEEFGDYKWSKGAVQFPLDRPLPADLIIRMVKFRVQDDLERNAQKKARC